MSPPQASYREYTIIRIFLSFNTDPFKKSYKQVGPGLVNAKDIGIQENLRFFPKSTDPPASLSLSPPVDEFKISQSSSRVVKPLLPFFPTISTSPTRARGLPFLKRYMRTMKTSMRSAPVSDRSKVFQKGFKSPQNPLVKNECGTSFFGRVFHFSHFLK